MARFACPTGSTYSSLSSDVNSRTRAPTNNARRESSSLPQREEKLAAVKDAKKKAHLLKKPHSVVFVGNLLPTITKDILRGFFSGCGHPTIDVRCTLGDPTVPPHTGNYQSNTNGRRYATLTWNRGSIYKRALKFDGRELQGVPVIVTTTISELPEVKDLVLGRIQERKQVFMPRKLGLHDEPTLLIPPSPHEIMGKHFPATVM